MKKSKSIYIFELILLIFIIMFKIFFVDKNSTYLLEINILFWLIFGVFVYLCYGFSRDNSFLKNSSIRIVVIIILLYFVINFLLGFVLGFTNNYIGNVLSILKKVSLYIIMFSFMEITRYMILKKNISKLSIVLLTIEYIILNIIIGINGYNLSGYKQIFITVSSIILPMIANEFLYTYMTKNISFWPTLIYKILIELYIFVLPVLPTLGNYIISVLGLLVPFLTFLEIRKNIHYRDKYFEYGKKTLKKSVIGITFVFIIIIVSLTSGIFKYQLVAIVTNSMSPTYERGDAVIINKKEVNEIKVGDVLAFNMGYGIITHRVTKINVENNVYTFTTKGDYNKLTDEYIITNENVIGTVDYILKYAGYPTVFVSELFERT